MRLPYASSPLTTTCPRPEPAAIWPTGVLGPGRCARRQSRRWETLLLWLLLAVVLLAPLPLGSNRPLPASALSAAVGALLCMWGVGCLMAQPQAIAPVRSFWPAVVLLSLAAAWA